MKCENCDTELKSGLFKSNQLLNSDAITLINKELNLDSKIYCNFCGDRLYKDAIEVKNKKLAIKNKKINNIIEILKHRAELINNYLNKNIKNIPVITTHTPHKWEYTSLELVSGQLVTGTGLVSEIFSDFTDFFGAKSNSFTEKISNSEEKVLNRLRSKAVLLGGNAVIATDIDYGEVGAAKGMLMICAAGTAVKLRNIEILKENKQEIIIDITSWQEEGKIIENILLSKKGVIIEKYEDYILKYSEPVKGQ